METRSGLELTAELHNPRQWNSP